MKNIFIVLAGTLILSACQKEMNAPDVEFEVTTSQQMYKTGDTVKFVFSGNPDNLTFFSGETGMKYEHRNRLKVEGEPRFEFTSFRQYGTQENSLHLFVSTDFNGVVDQNIGNANWTDITEKAILSTGNDNTQSGMISLKEFDNGKPLFLAFRFTGSESPSSAQRTWTIKDFAVQNVLADGGTLDVANMSDIGWSAVSVKNADKKWVISIDQIKIAGGSPNTPDNEDWVVTKPLNLSKVLPDRGIPLKSLTTRMNGFEYVFGKPGNYVVTFLATNATADEQKSVVREVNLTITP